MKDGPVAYCRNCGVRVPRDARYCPNCGTAVPEDDMAIEDIQNTIKSTPGLGKRMAKYSAVGAVIAIPVPVIGPIFGALAGAAYAYSKRNKRI